MFVSLPSVFLLLSFPLPTEEVPLAERGLGAQLHWLACVAAFGSFLTIAVLYLEAIYPESYEERSDFEPLEADGDAARKFVCCWIIVPSVLVL